MRVSLCIGNNIQSLGVGNTPNKACQYRPACEIEQCALLLLLLFVVFRERRKQKYSSLQGTVEELSGRLSQLNTLEVANNELQQRNTQLEVVVKEQTSQLQAQRETITRQAQQLQTQVCVLLFVRSGGWCEGAEQYDIHACLTLPRAFDRQCLWCPPAVLRQVSSTYISLCLASCIDTLLPPLPPPPHPPVLLCRRSNWATRQSSCSHRSV